MKLIPSSTARRRTEIASARSTGGPQTPLPVRRMEPNPKRVTRRSFPIENSPALLASMLSLRLAGSFVIFFLLARVCVTRHLDRAEVIRVCGAAMARDSEPLEIRCASPVERQMVCFRSGSCLGDANYVKNRKQRYEKRWDQA